jgi:hypothetical protein
VKRSFRLLLSAGLAAAALGSAAPAANAWSCAPEEIEVVCWAIGVPCRALGDNPKYHDLVCPPIA